ncbi:MAG: aminotransferase class III-fold pyridoxal phosphate-dependent enzyme [Oligoflexia bacterium]|nr:aminotransferase class III-fold pyridoxal phosphate-dependent enzyme [Oligoflexia bacterium]
MTEAQGLLDSARFRSAKTELLAAIAEASAKIRQIKPPSSPAARDRFQTLIQEFTRDRGRELYYPYIASGLGSGPYIELIDGSVKLDLITGIGVNLFGHSHPELMAEMIDAVPADIMQGNLEPGHEAPALLKAVLSRVGADKGCRLKLGWISTCGTMANEIALKIIRQKKAPATRVFAFKDCFCGRSTAMQEITDTAGYRQGQPVYGEVHHLSFYSPALGVEKSVERTLGEMKEQLKRYPDKFSCIMMEPVQGEGGFLFAPREWYVRVLEEAKKAGLAVWLDEIQTFGRTGELFAYQKFGLHELVDVVTIAKPLQASMVLFTEEYNPKPGLVAGTFTGSATSLRAARKTVEMLSQNGFLGPEGKIEKLSQRFVSNLSRLREGSCAGKIGEIRAIGGMIAFAPFNAAADDVKKTLMKLFDLGLIAFSCGHDPYLVRMLPPMGAMTEADVDFATSIIEKALVQL